MAHRGTQTQTRHCSTNFDVSFLFFLCSNYQRLLQVNNCVAVAVSCAFPEYFDVVVSGLVWVSWKIPGIILTGFASTAKQKARKARRRKRKRIKEKSSERTLQAQVWRKPVNQTECLEKNFMVPFSTCSWKKWMLWNYTPVNKLPRQVLSHVNTLWHIVIIPSERTAISFISRRGAVVAICKENLHDAKQRESGNQLYQAASHGSHWSFNQWLNCT